MTARRDLRELDREGLLQRVHGGAVSNLGRSYEPPYNLRSTQGTKAKQLIGAAAAAFITDGDSIGLDVGTTTLEIARALHDKQNVTILTSSLPIANEIAMNLSLGSQARLILTGGILRAGELSMVGHVAERLFKEMHVDKAFVGVGGLDLENGLTEFNLEDTLVKRALLDSAMKRIVVADGTKLGRTTFVSIAPLNMIDVVITDASAPPEVVEGLIERQIDVIVADDGYIEQQ
jgi:DeoR/GlpR family transcriptional regulator of sugar metabolism